MIESPEFDAGVAPRPVIFVRALVLRQDALAVRTIVVVVVHVAVLRLVLLLRDGVIGVNLSRAGQSFRSLAFTARWSEHAMGMYHSPTEAPHHLARHRPLRLADPFVNALADRSVDRLKP